MSPWAEHRIKGQTDHDDGALVDAFPDIAGFNTPPKAPSSPTATNQIRTSASSSLAITAMAPPPCPTAPPSKRQTASDRRCRRLVRHREPGAAAGDAPTAPGVLQAALGVRFGNRTGKLVFNHSSSDYVFAPALSVPWRRAWALSTCWPEQPYLTGDSSAFSGQTNVLGGALGGEWHLGRHPERGQRRIAARRGAELAHCFHAASGATLTPNDRRHLERGG